MTTASRLIVGPFNRVEGDLEVTLDIADGVVAAARVTAPLYRGFEHILQHRPVSDALVVAPRICGICSVAQSHAAAAAIAAVAGIEPAPNGRLAADLMLAAETVADHLTHFILFFLPDFARPAYAARPWFAEAQRRFQAMSGEAGRALLPARARFLHILGLLAGKWPHTLALQPGGSTKAVDTGEKVRLLAILAETRSFVETQVIGGPLEDFAALDSPAALAAWQERAGEGDLRLFLRIAADLDLQRLGGGPGRLMSYGTPLFAPGLWHQGGVVPLDLGGLREDASHAWLAGPPHHPAEGRTQPDADKAGAYSWCKAPRLDGAPVEVGALARQMIDGQPLLRTLVGASGSNVRDRVLARLVETARLLPAMEQWARALRPREPFCVDAPPPESGAAAGLVEAARGGLGHWLRAEGGRIAHYQIVAPTTWNFSPRDAAGIPGPLEGALVGTPVQPGETTPVAVQHVVRSFDPCMVCTVH
jgi:hydrogenase large subunit